MSVGSFHGMRQVRPFSACLLSSMSLRPSKALERLRIKHSLAWPPSGKSLTLNHPFSPKEHAVTFHSRPFTPLRPSSMVYFAIVANVDTDLSVENLIICGRSPDERPPVIFRVGKSRMILPNQGHTRNINFVAPEIIFGHA